MTMRVLSSSFALLTAVLATACTVKEGRAPAAIPAGIAIPVTVAGAPPAMLDSAWLARTTPDFVDAEDRRAWKLSTLAGPAADEPGALVEVATADGLRLLKPHEKALVLATVNRGGELLVLLADPSDPFPSFHGRGGNRGHSGEDGRIRGVHSIRIAASGERR